MLDLLSRACLHPIAYSRFLNKQNIFFKEKIRESENVYSFIFTPEKTFTWKPGQHAIFTMPNRKIEGKTWRPFSVASAPHEGVIRIGTNVPEKHSDFKQKLLELRPGDPVTMHGPFGEFYVRKNCRHIIGIAGGIGITPFRSILGELTHQRSPVHITLIYSTAKDHTYRQELDKWQDLNENLNVVYTRTPEEVNNAIDALTATYSNNAHYFVSGSPGMIGAVRQTLKSKGIKKIYNDPFKGY